VSRAPRAKDAPKTIPAGQQADGFWVVRPQWMMKGNVDYVMAAVTASPSLVERARTGSAVDEDAPVACVTNGTFDSSDDSDQPWGGSMQSVNTLTFQKVGSYGHRVQPVHRERLTEAGASATLEYEDAWVDIVTLGSRAIAKGELPLVRVGTGPGGAAVFAARDGDEVDFVARADTTTAAGTASFVRNQLRSLTAAEPPFGFQSTDCGFLRLAFRASRGSGETATVSMRVMLPSLPSTPAGTARTRPLLFHVSSSQSTADAEPVLSVVPAWEDRAEGQRFAVVDNE
jgi:hypothetical protein